MRIPFAVGPRAGLISGDGTYLKAHARLQCKKKKYNVIYVVDIPVLTFCKVAKLQNGVLLINIKM